MSEPINRQLAGHRLFSRHDCACGWSGEDAITHIVDALALRHEGRITDGTTDRHLYSIGNDR